MKVLSSSKLNEYVARFNTDDDEMYVQSISNSKAAGFLSENIPFFECPDNNLERTYYFRWWIYRKHIKETPHGYIITEFLPDVTWGGPFNAISCAGSFHFMEGRWLKDTRYLRDYGNFWLRHAGTCDFDSAQNFKGNKWVQAFGFPISYGLLQFHMVHPCRDYLVDLLEELIVNYEELKAKRFTETGLYFSLDGGLLGDGMEYGISGAGVRPSANSYQYSQAKAISKIAAMKGDDELSARYEKESEVIAKNIMALLWDDQAKFFKTIRKDDISTGKLADARELIGYIPWFYGIPDKGKGYEEAWKQVVDVDGFCAQYGLTTAEQRHPDFKISYTGHDCFWDGPVWPYATSQTLVAMANVLRDYPQNMISRKDYFNVLMCYARSHEIELAGGRVVPWIDENQHPFTGEWIARAVHEASDSGYWSEIPERGKDYNHSSFNDLIITGLVGLRPRGDDTVVIDPLLSESTWEYFCLDKVPYHGRELTIVWDRTGLIYNKGTGLSLFADGRKIAGSKTLSKISGNLGQ